MMIMIMRVFFVFLFYNAVLDDNVKSNEKRQNFKILSLFLSAYSFFFSTFFVVSLLW